MAGHGNPLLCAHAGLPAFEGSRAFIDDRTSQPTADPGGAADAGAWESQASCRPGPLQPLAQSQCDQQARWAQPPPRFDACKNGGGAAAAAGSQHWRQQHAAAAATDAASQRHHGLNETASQQQVPQPAQLLPRSASQVTTQPAEPSQPAEASEPMQSGAAAVWPAATPGLTPSQATTQPACDFPDEAFQLPQRQPDAAELSGGQPQQLRSAAAAVCQQAGEDAAAMPLPLPLLLPSQADSCCGAPSQGDCPDAGAEVAMEEPMLLGDAGSQRTPLVPTHR